MDSPVVVAKPQEQTTVASAVQWIVFHKFTSHDNFFHLLRRNHPFGPRHLANGMRQEQQLFFCGLSRNIHNHHRVTP